MATNSVNSQVNQNTQVHPKDDPNIAFHHTFKALLPTNSKQVYIIEGRNIIFKIPIKAFWNSSQCSDTNYYTINTLDLENSTTSTKYVVRNPSLKTYSEDSDYFDSYSVISEAAFHGTDENVRPTPFIIKGKQIPELERNYRIKYHEEMQFPFVQANQADDCKVLTVQENEQSHRKFNLPSVACKYDNGKITCGKFGTFYNIQKPENSATYYMTATKDLNNNYKFYFSDKDGNKTNDLELSLSDIRIKEEVLLKYLEVNHNLKKLQGLAQTIETHLKSGTDSFEEGTAKTITSHLEKNAVQVKLADSLSENTKFIQNVKDNINPSPSAVAESLLKSRGPELGEAMLHAIQSNEGNSDIVCSRLARDTNLQTKVANLLVNQKADQLGRAVLDIKDADQKSKLAVELASNDVLKEDVKDLLKGDIARDVDSVPQMARSIQEIESKMESEENRVLQLKSEAISALNKSIEYAQKSQNEADRSKTAADESTKHALRSKNAANDAEKHALRSETAAGKSEVHEIKAKEHRENAETSSSSAAAFADNAEESAVCAKNPLLPQCLSSSSLSRSRREATWEEPESQYEESGLIFLPTDSVSVI